MQLFRSNILGSQTISEAVHPVFCRDLEGARALTQFFDRTDDCVRSSEMLTNSYRWFEEATLSRACLFQG